MVFWGEKKNTFPGALQFSLNTTLIGLISYLRPGGRGVRGQRLGLLQAIVMLGWQCSLGLHARATIPPFKSCLWANPGSPSLKTEINSHSNLLPQTHTWVHAYTLLVTCLAKFVSSRLTEKCSVPTYPIHTHTHTQITPSKPMSCDIITKASQSS